MAYQRLKPLNDRKCTVQGCENVGNIRRGYCNKHYRRWRRHGDPLGGGPEQNREENRETTTVRVEKQCSVEGCSNVLLAQGLCSAHYGRWARYGDPLGGGPPRKPFRDQVLSTCSVDGCEKVSVCKGYCQAHYQRYRKGEKVNVPLTRQNIGEPQYVQNGYIAFTDKDHPMAVGKHGRVAQHRAVMSEVLGRPLRKNELVHHINGIRHDNRPENLELFYKGHPPGQRPEELVKWAHEILALYEEEVKQRTKLKLVI